MSRSTTHRYVITLVALGYLEQGASRKYRLGLKVTDLGMAALNATGLREHAREDLEELRVRSSYTVNLGVLDGTDVLYVERARKLAPRPGQNRPRPAPRLAVPAYCTSMGKILLAYLPEEKQRELIGEMTLTKMGPNTITSKKALREELEQVQEEGLAVNDQELEADLYSIAAPVRNEAREVVAAVNMAAHSSMISSESSSTHSARTWSRPPIASPRGSATGATTSRTEVAYVIQ